MPQPDSTQELIEALAGRILVLDGAMGTTIRAYGLSEADARGGRFADNDKDLLNNGDILSITRPDVIGDIHRRFYEAGSDICETNTFSATSIAQSEFFVEDPRDRRAQESRVLSENHHRPVSQRSGVGNERGVLAALPKMGG
jgi:5-methyltetrahydrofolate--homocysteine methyltransferase